MENIKLLVCKTGLGLMTMLSDLSLSLSPTSSLSTNLFLSILFQNFISTFIIWYSYNSSILRVIMLSKLLILVQFTQEVQFVKIGLTAVGVECKRFSYCLKNKTFYNKVMISKAILNAIPSYLAGTKWWKINLLK